MEKTLCGVADSKYVGRTHRLSMSMAMDLLEIYIAQLKQRQQEFDKERSSQKRIMLEQYQKETEMRQEVAKRAEQIQLMETRIANADRLEEKENSERALIYSSYHKVCEYFLSDLERHQSTQSQLLKTVNKTQQHLLRHKQQIAEDILTYSCTSSLSSLSVAQNHEHHTDIEDNFCQDRQSNVESYRMEALQWGEETLKLLTQKALSSAGSSEIEWASNEIPELSHETLKKPQDWAQLIFSCDASTPTDLSPPLAPTISADTERWLDVVENRCKPFKSFQTDETLKIEAGTQSEAFILSENEHWVRVDEVQKWLMEIGFLQPVEDCKQEADSSKFVQHNEELENSSLVTEGHISPADYFSSIDQSMTFVEDIIASEQAPVTSPSISFTPPSLPKSSCGKDIVCEQLPHYAQPSKLHI